MVRIMASHGAPSGEDSSRSSAAQARLGSSAASGCPKAITPVNTPTARTNERRSALCTEPVCVAHVFTSGAPPGTWCIYITAKLLLLLRFDSVAQTTATICHRALLDFTHSEQEPVLQRTHLEILIE